MQVADLSFQYVGYQICQDKDSKCRSNFGNSGPSGRKKCSILHINFVAGLTDREVERYMPALVIDKSG
jgi:hypothetical protein